MGQASDVLADLPAFQRHLAWSGSQDPIFFLSHRHFLVRGLAPRERVDAALAHYRHESSAYVRPYLDRVYSSDGFVLWQQSVDNVAYDIRLMPGHDVLNEGGLSVVLHVDGGRVCVMSYSMAPRAMVTGEPAGKDDKRVLPLLVRKQLTQDHSYQAAFNKAFDRTTPGHLVLGALGGLALAQGMEQVAAVDAAHQISCTPDKAGDFVRAYDEFWHSAGGRHASPFGYLMAMPMELPSLEEMNARQRKRARTRRAHIEAVQESAAAAIREVLAGSAEVAPPAHPARPAAFAS